MAEILTYAGFIVISFIASGFAPNVVRKTYR